MGAKKRSVEEIQEDKKTTVVGGVDGSKVVRLFTFVLLL